MFSDHNSNNNKEKYIIKVIDMMEYFGDYS